MKQEIYLENPEALHHWALHKHQDWHVGSCEATCQSGVFEPCFVSKTGGPAIRAENALHYFELISGDPLLSPAGVGEDSVALFQAACEQLIVSPEQSS